MKFNTTLSASKGRDQRMTRTLTSRWKELVCPFLFAFGLAAAPAFAQVTVTGSTGANATYTSLTNAGGAFAAINAAGSQTGNNILITITADVTTEAGTNGLNAGTWATLTINPSGARTISGAAASAPLINLNGADNVTINGFNTGGNSLTISNTNTGTTAGTSTIRFIADASNNTVTNCTILGSSTSTLGTVAGTILFSTGTTTGNDSDIISNCNIGPAGANLPSKAMMASGSSSSIENDNVQITGNNIFDYFIATTGHTAINVLTGNEGWTISNNKFYQTGTRTFTSAGLRHSAVTLNNSTGSFTISGNTIGFASAAGTGTYTITGSSNEFRGIDAPSVNTSPASSIQGNTISGISVTSSRASTTLGNSAFIGITIGETGGLFNVGTTTGNTVGSLDGSSSISLAETSTTANTAPFMGIYDFSFANSNISNNKFGTITISSGGSGTTVGFRGILINGTSGQAVTVNNNTIGGTALGSITDSVVGSYNMFGIQDTATTTSANISATGNLVRNMSGNSTASGSIISSALIISPATAGANTISQNTIHSLFNASGAVANSVYGMSFTFPSAANLVERNFIHSLSLTSTVTGTQVWGINGGAAGTATYQNNMIRLGLDAAGTAITLPTSMIGIRDSVGATNQFYHNSVYIGGTGVLATPSASNSYCFFSDVVTVVRNFQDNIFWNARSNAVGGGVAHLAIRVGGTTANPTGLTSNYNDLYFSGTDGATGVFNSVVVSTLAAWRTATGQDVNSFAGDPQFIAPNGTATTGDLHIHPTNPTPIESSGLAIGAVTNDFDGQTRSTLTPTDVGADAGNFAPLDISPPNISYAALGNTTSTTNRTLPATITDATGVPTTGTGLPVIYYRKGTSGAFASTQALSGGGSSYTFTIDYSLVTGGSVAAGDTIQYYVAAQDTVTPTPNVTTNPSAGASGFTANPPAASTPPTTPNSYQIQASISGSFNVGTGQTYATITDAVNDLNTKVVTGPVTLLLTDSSYASGPGNGPNLVDAFPLTINPNSGSSATNTITIKPASGVTATMSAAVASGALLTVKASWVIIDGSNSGGTDRSLTITNSSTTAPTAIALASSGTGAGATNNVIKNCNISTGVATSIGYGISVGGTTPGTAGADNDNVTIQNNNITVAPIGIYANGTTSVTSGGDDGLSVKGNSVDYNGTLQTIGIQVGNALNSSVSQNTVSEQTSASTNAVTAISIETGFVSSSVTGNLITKSLVTATGGFGGRGITVGTGTASSALQISNNVVYGVNGSDFSGFSNSSSMGIAIGMIGNSSTITTTAGGINLYFNSVRMTGNIGSFSTSAITTALYIGSGASALDIRNNVFANTQTGNSTTQKNYAIFSAAANTAFTTINYNDYFASNSFNAASAIPGFIGSDRTNLAAIQTGFGQNANSIVADPLFNSSTNLQPQIGSPVLDVGTSLSGTVSPYVDFTGATRVDPPSMGAYELGTDTAAPVISYTPLANTVSTTNRALTSTITDPSGVPTSGIGLPVIYYRKGASGSYASTQGTFAGGNSYTFTIDYANVTGGSVTAGDTIQYYVVAQDTAPTPNVGSNPSTGASGFTANPPAASTPPSPANSYSILATISGTKTVGAGGDYPDITGAVNALNNSVITGAVTFLLTDSSYSSRPPNGPNAPDAIGAFPLTINANSGSSSTNTVTFKPAPGQTVAMTGSAATALMTLNGADWVIIDGSNNGTSSRDLTITNTNTGTSSAVIWLQSNGADGATNNVVKNVILVGSGNTQTLFGVGSGSSTISITSTGTGNNNNTFQNCDISKTQYGIYSGGASAANKNTGNVIASNLINTASPNNVAIGGILVNFESGILIGANNIAHISSATTPAFGITLGTRPSNSFTTFTGSEVTGAIVSQNLVDDIFRNGDGTSFGIGVATVTSASAAANTIANNMISRVRTSATPSDFAAGILLGGGTTGSTLVYFNSISMTGAGATTAPTFGIVVGGSNPVVDLRDNIFYNTQTTSTGKTYAIGLTYSSPYSNLTSDYNDFVSTGATASFAVIGGLTGTDRVSLAAWRAETGKDTNSLAVDPVFISTSNLHLSTTAQSPVDRKAIAIAGIGFDIDGNARNAVPDIGADEVNFAGTLQFTSATSGVNENAGSAVVTVTRVGGADGSVGVLYNRADGTAVSPGDYTAPSGNFIWPDGDTTNRTITATIVDDTVYEYSEDFSLVLSAPSGGATLGTPSTTTVTITDNDSAPTLMIDSPTVSEGAGNVVFTVTQSAATERTTTFRYDTADGTAVAPGDYTATVNGLGTITPGNLSTTISIPINNDSVYEGNETFTVTLSNQMFGAERVNMPKGTISNVGTATIQDNDSAPTVQFSSATYGVNENAGMATITVTKTGATELSATVGYGTSDGTATQPGDYTQTSGTLTFLPNETSKTFDVPINNDGSFEGSENFSVGLSSPTGSTLGSPSSATVTINDDDALPLVQFSASNFNVNEGDGTVTVTVTKTGSTLVPATVNYGTSDGSATQPADYTQTSGMLTFLPNDTSKTFTVPIASDNTYEGDEQFTVTLSTPVGASLGSPNPATVTIVEDDAAPSFSVDDITHSEGAAGQTSYSFTVTKTGSTALNATVDYATVNGTAVAPGDYTAIPTTGLTFLPNETTKPVTVMVNGDTTPEPNETFTVHLSNAGNATISDADGLGTITNDDGQPPIVYVDDNWAGTTPGTDPDGAGPATSFGFDAFDTVEGGVAGVAPNGQVIVYAGNYLLATNVAVNKSVSILGPNVGNSPNSVANRLKARVAEAVVNGNAGAFNGSSGKNFNITAPATTVTISGFKFTNFDGTVIAEAGGAALTNVDLHQNIFDTNNGSLMYKFNITQATAVSFTDNKVANQSMTGINTALLFMGKLTNSHFDNNDVSNVASREFINLYDSLTSSTISHNTLTNTAGLALLAANQNLVTFDANTITSTATAPGVGAIYVSSNDGRTITNLAITNNIITTVTGGGIGIRLSTDTATAASITGVMISGNTVSGTSAYGLDLDTFATTGTGTISNVNVQNNQFINNAFGPMLAYARPTSGTNVVSNLTLDGNTFTESAAIFGASFVQIDLRNVSGTNTITGNTYTLSGVLPPSTTSLQAIGIRGNKTGTFNITNNNLAGGGVLHNGSATVFQSGIRIFSNDATTGVLPATAVIDAHNNFINGWEDGVVVRDGVAAVYGGLLAGTQVKFNNDDLSGNSLKTIRTGNGEIVDGSNSWWGTNSQAAVSSSTSGLVDFTPYLDSGTDTNAAAGFQGSFGTLHATTLGSQSGATARIQEGINSVTSGGILNVHAGTYTGNADATANSVTLAAGSSPGQVTINGNVTLSSDDTVPIEINGTNAASDYDNFVVNGTVTLGGATLAVSGTHTPTAGQSFTIVDNDSTDAVTGTFAGLGEGATLTFNGVLMKITYAGGSNGNDVVLSPVTYTVTYDSNGGMGSQTDPNSPYLSGSTVTVLGPGTITRTGYTFAGWNTAANGSGTSYNPGATFTITSNVTLYAQWTINTYTLSYNGNGNTGGSAPVDPNSPYNYNSTVTVLGPGTLTKTGYTFSHWNTAADDSGTSYNPGATFSMPANNVVLYAQWTINTYTVTYDGNGNTGGAAPVDSNSPYNYNSTVTVLDQGSLVRTGYTFSGWNTAANGSGTSYSPGATFNITANTVLYAQWAASTFTLTYNGNGNTAGAAPVDPNSPYNANSTVTVLGPGTLVRTGFAFAHWNTAADDSGTSYNPGATFSITANTVLYAQWTACGSVSTVYVDDSWAGTPSGSDPDGAGPATTFGCDSFATIQEAVNAVTNPGTVIVRAGNYAENISTTKTLTMKGAQFGVDARGRVVGAPNPAVESIWSPATAGTGTFILNATTTASSVDGFTFTGGTSLGVIQTQSGSDYSNLQISNNYFSGYSQSAVFMNRGGNNITIEKNVMDGSNISGSGQAIFANSGPTFAGLWITNNNIVNNTGRYGFFVDSNHTVGESATRAPKIDGNLFNNNLQGLNLGSRSFGTLAAPTLGAYGGYITNNTFSNHAANGIQAGIQHVLVQGNTFNNNPRSGLALTSFGNTGADRGAQNSDVLSNTFINNGNGGDPNNHEALFFSGTQGVGLIGTNKANFNRFVGNAVAIQYGSSVNAGNNATINVENNWFSCNYGPGAGGAGCTGTANGAVVFAGNTGILDFNPWIVLGASASPDMINPFGSSTVTADMTRNSDNVVPSMTMFIPSVGVAFSATEGNMSPPSGTITSGQATSMFTSTSSNNATASASVDNQTATANITIITYTVTYNGNGNTGGAAPVDPNNYTSGSTVTVLGPGSLVRTGYTFSHWNTAADDSGTSYNPGATFTITSNVTLYAQWTINTYTVTYNGNGNTGGTVPVDPNSPYNYNSTVTVLGPGTLVRTGYTFSHWNTAADDSGTSYNPGATFTMPASNVILYAQWTINTYTVTYNGNGNTGGTAPADPNSPYNYNSTVTVLGPGTLTKTGYTFAHWNTAADDSGTSYNPADTFSIVSNVTLYAQWTPKPPPAITYVDDNWTSVPSGQDPDGAGPATEMGYDAFSTIQGGVSGVATTGAFGRKANSPAIASMVVVYAGIYTETVNVNKSVALVGPQAGVNPSDVNWNDVRTNLANEAVIEGALNLSIQNTISVDGFTLNRSSSNEGHILIGGGLPGGSHTTTQLAIQNNRITGSRSTGATWAGIHTNFLDNFPGPFSLPGANLTITNNRIVIGGSASGDGVLINRLVPGTDNNSSLAITGNYIASDPFNGSAVATTQTQTSIGVAQITGNYLPNGEVAMFRTLGANIANNQMITPAFDGVWLNGGDDNITVSGNTITNPPLEAIVIGDFGFSAPTPRPNSNITVVNNTVTIDATLLDPSSGPTYSFFKIGGGLTGTNAINSNSLTISGALPSGITEVYGIHVHNRNIGAGSDPQPVGSVTMANNTLTGGGLLGGSSAGLKLDSNLTSSTEVTFGDGNSVTGFPFGVDVARGTAHISGSLISGSGTAVRVDATNSGSDPVTMTITNTTLSDNTAATGAGVHGIGTSGMAKVTITNSTLSKNSPSGAGILLQDASLTVGNTIFNTTSPGTNISALGTSLVTSIGYNLSSDGFAGFLTNASDQINTDPILGPLKNNGGPTKSRAPLSNSPAIDRGKDLGPIGPSYAATGIDQRGSVRPVTYDGSIVPPAGGDRSDIGAVELPPGVIPTSADSHKIHGAAGDFAINLPLSGPVGVECRSGGASNAFKVIITFATPVSYSTAAVNTGTGTVSSDSGSGTNQVTVNLTGVTNAQRVTIALFGVNDGVNGGDVGVRMGVLLGDVSNEGSVNSTDASQVKLEVGNPVGASNFRNDVTVSGDINATDVSVTKLKSGTGLP
jgi:uncharacterized repeat protein (TIGR02543 family)